MKARRTKAWMCGSCNRVYADSDFGKEQAAVCCSCRECGARGQYVGTSSLCHDCLWKSELKAAVENLRNAEIRVARARAKKGKPWKQQ